jgi:hypothetical protein
MEWNLGTILILIVVLLVGYGLGLLEAYLRNSGKLKEAQREIAELQAAKENAIPDSTTTTSALSVDLNPDQSIDIKLDGSGLIEPQSVSSEQRRRLISLLGKMRPWVEGGPVMTTPMASQTSTISTNSLQSVPTPNAETITDDKTPVSQQDKSMIKQIDDILQKLMEGTPLESRRIMLLESMTGGVLVQVGNEQYDGIDSVPDAEIQTAIRQAVAKWENG